MSREWLRVVWVPLAAAAVALALAAGTAQAAEPSVIDTAAPASGRSAWTYSDLHDAYAKYEGGYAAFDDTSTSTYTDVPHGGYSTATDKCSVCHAVHRAEAAYELTRGEWRGDACSYCHVGSAHSSKVVYDGNPEGMGTAVGHTVGASPSIPLSTPYYVSLDTTVVSAVTASGTVATTTVPVRAVDSARNRMYRLRLRHGQSAAGSGAAGYERIGPLSLTCLSCHVAHGEQAGQWRPRSFPGHAARLDVGYKLLRAWPSGSIQGPDSVPYDNGVPGFTVSYTKDGQRAFGTYGDFGVTGLVDAQAVVAAPETTLTPASVGLPQTTWDSVDWSVPGAWSSKPATVSSAAIDPRGVDQYALSVWCADCHNLAIGRYQRPTTVSERLEFDAAPVVSDDALTVPAETSDTPVLRKTLLVDTTGATTLRVVTSLRTTSPGDPVSARVDLGSGIDSATHSTSSDSFVTFTDTFAVPGSTGTTSVTLWLWRTGAPTGAENTTFGAYLGRAVTVVNEFVADLDGPAHETSMTHTSPMASAYNGPGQCYTCHRSGLAAAPATAAFDPARAACERCHYGTGAYAADPARLAGASDFPHSGETSGADLLGAWTFDAAGGVVPTEVTGGNTARTVCRRCHVQASRTHTMSPVP